MALLAHLLLSRSEKHLAPYRTSAAKIETELQEEYHSYLPIIKECYDRATYWHGTGHYHYHHPSDSRYGVVDIKKTIDVLGSIIAHGGLASHHDLFWVNTDGQLRKTVSLAPSRMHARLYAHIHLREGVWLKYVFGGTRFWMSFFIIVAAQELVLQLRRGQWNFLRQAVLNRAFLRHARTWASAICNVEQYTVLPVWRVYDLRSDIPGNHPVLFGIKKDAVSGDGILPFLKRVEVRIDQPISLTHFTHIEVPQAHVEKIKKMLAEKNITLPVIPLEFGELYCSRMSLAQLTHV